MGNNPINNVDPDGGKDGRGGGKFYSMNSATQARREQMAAERAFDNPWWGDLLYQVNKFNPLAILVNSISAYATGRDTYNVEMSNAEASVNLATIVPIGKIVGVGTKLIGSAVRAVEQYSLRAAESGFYPVMKRGFKGGQELTWLNKGEVWKFGTTKNPFSRYSQSYLDNIGEHGVIYTTEFRGTLQQATFLERLKILNYRFQNNYLPPGNKIIK